MHNGDVDDFACSHRAVCTQATDDDFVAPPPPPSPLLKRRRRLVLALYQTVAVALVLALTTKITAAVDYLVALLLINVTMHLPMALE